ncbi:PREDICTED: PDZ domain-containing protein 8 [Nicrophorus vespilloides]|uniref:PDZ domain-containing protein 8 n=1 Tax=Nicrophorus vespilloides TaxID=110193 RepID=A0ABM1MEP4_NICVS|nr:PREDICTED: PDZ domain-containing protein 8 [Nicrophorus vespilloides]
MDFFSFIILTCVSVFVGAILTLVIQYYVLVRYFNKAPIVEEVPKKINPEAYCLPEELKKLVDSPDGKEKAGSSLPISLMLQFLFHELRHSDSIKKWLYKKLSLEFDELLTKTTIGKFFEAVTIRDMHLGTQFPDIKNIALDKIKLDDAEGHIETLNLSVTLDYTGNFSLSVGAKMKFGKTAYLSIKVKRIAGLARLQFTRTPYTHWSFSFYTEPEMEFAVESHFQGRQLQSNITNLIVNQIKKAIKRKHTLPNYKIRYKPFFVKTDPGQMESEETDVVPQGFLEVSCTEVSRLAVGPEIQTVYCTFTIDTIPFVSIHERDGSFSITLELTMTKVRQQQLGVIFKQEANTVIVESVTPQTPAAIAGLKPADIVLAIENKNITNVSQISKIIKSITSVNISIKIERISSGYYYRQTKTDRLENPVICVNDEDVVEQESFVVLEKPEEVDVKKPKTKSDKMPKLISGGNENMSKFAQTLGNFTLRKRKTSVERASSGDSNKSTPTPSCPSTPQHSFKQAITIPANFILNKKNSISEMPEILQAEENLESDLIDIHKSKEIGNNSIITFNDDFLFKLKETHKYLNVNVWGKIVDKDTLLGFANIPLSEILNACCHSMLGHYVRTYSFLPPSNTIPNMQNHPLMSHSGFEHVFCYGDILLSFVWSHDENIEMRRKNSVVTNDLERKPSEKQTGNQHDFIRTQFHRTIHCDFCSKKIWLKDAVQCRDCGLCCHKKCIAKCQTSTDCVPNKPEAADVSQPEIIMTEACDDIDDDMDLAMKRVNSANNLCIPGAPLQACQSRSLPPTPQRTPSRKQSLVMANPFSLCPSALDEIQADCTQDMYECITRLLEQILLYSSDENLMEIAKETGRQLYSSMQEDEKMDKITAMMTELKKTFDTITNEHADISKRLGAEESEVEKAKLAFLLGQADAKIQGLSVLMLHYCSGLQHSQ